MFLKLGIMDFSKHLVSSILEFVCLVKNMQTFLTLICFSTLSNFQKVQNNTFLVSFWHLNFCVHLIFARGGIVSNAFTNSPSSHFELELLLVLTRREENL